MTFTTSAPIVKRRTTENGASSARHEADGRTRPLHRVGVGRARAFGNIGIRIEDMVAVTPAGPDILTAGLPKSAGDIEALVQARQGGDLEGAFAESRAIRVSKPLGRGTAL